MLFRRAVIGVCGLILASAFAACAFADQSAGFQVYFDEGVKAFKVHDDQKALRCFKIAQIYDPSDPGVGQYLDALKKRSVTLELPASPGPSDDDPGYKYYLSKGIEALGQHDNIKAIHYFNIALIFDPGSKEADQYLEGLAQPTSMVAEASPRSQLEVSPSIPSSASQETVVQAQPSLSVTQPQGPAAAKPIIYVEEQKAKGPVTVILLSQIASNAQSKPKMQLVLDSSVIFEGRNIQRSLIVDEGFIGVKTINADQIEVDAQKIGTTFLHIWDEFGRHTIYIEVVFPKSVTSSTLPSSNGIQHSQPFIATYSNDWNNYYAGPSVKGLKRQSYQFTQTLGVKGETPFGYFDSSGTYIDFNKTSQFDAYSIGLSQIPLEGTSDFNLRVFDALRYMSPLTMPGTQLRGVFADVDLLDNNLGLSFSHGQQAEQEFENFTAIGNAQYYNAYIDAAKLTLFPKSETDRYSFNFANAHGPQRPGYLSDHVYSLEGQHKFNDHLTLNAEEGNDSNHDASLASLKWQEGTFRSGLNFRNIDKNYTTISGFPSNQGELGATWTTDAELKDITESTFLEAYRDRLDTNPDKPNAFNYDGNGHLRANLTPNTWSDTDFNFVATPGELSPQQSLALNERLSRSFGVWNSLKGNFFGGGGYQYSHSTDSNISNYTREDVITGIQLPLTEHISSFANYEYDWLSQPHSGGNSYPNVINAGLEYQKQLTPKFSVNSQLDYRDELGVKTGSNFLSGEESVIITSGFSYNPTPDMTIFADGSANKIISHVGNPTYDDFEFHLGMRMTFGGSTYWDPLGTVSGIVFKDRNQDGKFTAGEEGLAGIKLKVGDKEVVTDKRGHFSVQIRAKWVQVTPEFDTVPGGLIFSTPQTYNVEVYQGRTTKVDFGLISQTGIYGIVFMDKNNSTTPNDNDKFIGKVNVLLDDKIVQKSDSHGAFYFRKVAPGPHTIAIDINSLALDMVPLVQLKTKIDVAEGTNYMFNIPVQIKKAQGDQN